jgi:hypothetical protein
MNKLEIQKLIAWNEQQEADYQIKKMKRQHQEEMLNTGIFIISEQMRIQTMLALHSS